MEPAAASTSRGQENQVFLWGRINNFSFFRILTLSSLFPIKPHTTCLNTHGKTSSHLKHPVQTAEKRQRGQAKRLTSMDGFAIGFATFFYRPIRRRKRLRTRTQRHCSRSARDSSGSMQVLSTMFETHQTKKEITMRHGD